MQIANMFALAVGIVSLQLCAVQCGFTDQRAATWAQEPQGKTRPLKIEILKEDRSVDEAKTKEFMNACGDNHPLLVKGRFTDKLRFTKAMEPYLPWNTFFRYGFHDDFLYANEQKTQMENQLVKHVTISTKYDFD